MESWNCSEIDLDSGWSVSSTHLTTSVHVIVVLALVFSLVAVFTVLSNTVVIISLIFSRPADFIITTTLVTSLAVSDALLGSFIMPLGVYELIHYGNWYLPHTLCNIRMLCDTILCTVSVLHVMCLAIDRYLAVCHPLKHRTLTKRTALVMVFFSWTIPVLVFLIPYVAEEPLGSSDKLYHCMKNSNQCGIVFSFMVQIVSVSVSFYFPTMVIFFLYCRIFYEIKQHEKNLKAMTTSSTSISMNSIVNTFSSDLLNNRNGGSTSQVQDVSSNKTVSRKFFGLCPRSAKTKSLPKKRNKAVWTIACIVLCFVACWFPFSILVVINRFEDDTIPNWLLQATSWLGYANSALNPPLYCFNKSIRTAIGKTLCWSRQRMGTHRYNMQRQRVTE